MGPLAPAIAGALKIAAGSGGGKGTAAGSRQRRLPLTLLPVHHGLTGLDVANQAISLCPRHGTLGCLTMAYRGVSLVASLWHIGASLEPTVAVAPQGVLTLPVGEQCQRGQSWCGVPQEHRGWSLHPGSLPVHGDTSARVLPVRIWCPPRHSAHTPLLVE